MKPEAERRVPSVAGDTASVERRGPGAASRHFPEHGAQASLRASGFTLQGARSRRSTSAFTLMEVMIASALFFMATFAILALVAQCLRNARHLQKIEVTAGMVAAQLYKTNQLTEGREVGDFENLYRDFSWETDSQQIGSNGLWQVDIVVRRRGQGAPVDAMSVWIFSPNSKSSSFGMPNIRP